jgi:hypothetical protein
MRARRNTEIIEIIIRVFRGLIRRGRSQLGVLNRYFNRNGGTQNPPYPSMGSRRLPNTTTPLKKIHTISIQW